MRDQVQSSVTYQDGIYLKHVPTKQQYKREVAILAALEGVSAPKIHTRSDKDRTFHVESAGRDLESLLLQEEYRFNIGQIRQILRGLLLALQDIHSKNICHYDVTPRNVCINENSEDIFQVKLIDFGLSFFIDDIPESHRENNIGTPSCLSPEHVNRSPEYGIAADIFCAGITILQLIQGGDEFLSLSLGDLKKQLSSAAERIPSRTYWREEIPDDLKSALKVMLSVDPNHRLIDSALSFLGPE